MARINSYYPKFSFIPSIYDDFVDKGATIAGCACRYAWLWE